MEGVEFEPRGDGQAAEKAELLKVFNAALKDDDFVRAWLSRDGAELKIVAGVEDDGSHSAVCLIPRIYSEELAYIYIPLELMRTWHPEVKCIESYITGFGEVEQERDNDSLRARRDELGLTYHEDLGEDLGPLAAVYCYALPFVISYDAQVSFVQLIDLDLYCDDTLADKSLHQDRIVSCFMSYHSSTTRNGMRPGFGESCYARL